jgi:hypothetical protein
MCSPGWRQALIARFDRSTMENRLHLPFAPRYNRRSA